MLKYTGGVILGEQPERGIHIPSSTSRSPLRYLALEYFLYMIKKATDQCIIVSDYLCATTSRVSAFSWLKHSA